MTVQSINLNGNILDEDKVGLSVHNRAFKYGDSLFETIRVINGKALFLEDHFSRLSRGMKTLHYDLPNYWDLAYFKKEIQKLLDRNEVNRGGRVRFTVFRKGEGYYTPKSSEFGFTIEAYSNESNSFILNETGLKLGIYDEVRLSINKFSPFKTTNLLTYIDAGIQAKSTGFDDVLLMNTKGNLVESVSSNVFLYINGILYTPSINEGPVAGILRKKIIQLAKKNGKPVIETSISISVLEEASEIFLTNAISGIKWVSGFGKTRYFHKEAEFYISELNKISA